MSWTGNHRNRQKPSQVLKGVRSLLKRATGRALKQGVLWSRRCYIQQLYTVFAPCRGRWCSIHIHQWLFYWWVCKRLCSLTDRTFRAALSAAGIASSATPAQVCEQLKKMVKSSSPSLTSVTRMSPMDGMRGFDQSPRPWQAVGLVFPINLGN